MNMFIEATQRAESEKKYYLDCLMPPELLDEVNGAKLKFFGEFKSFDEATVAFQATVFRPLINFVLCLKNILDVLSHISLGLVNMYFALTSLSKNHFDLGKNNLKNGINIILRAAYFAFSIVYDTLKECSKFISSILGTILGTFKSCFTSDAEQYRGNSRTR